MNAKVDGCDSDCAKGDVGNSSVFNTMANEANFATKSRRNIGKKCHSKKCAPPLPDVSGRPREDTITTRHSGAHSLLPPVVSVLIVTLSYGARNVLSYTRHMMQNSLAFRDSPIIPLRRSPSLHQLLGFFFPFFPNRFSHISLSLTLPNNILLDACESFDVELPIFGNLRICIAIAVFSPAFYHQFHSERGLFQPSRLL